MLEGCLGLRLSTGFVFVTFVTYPYRNPRDGFALEISDEILLSGESRKVLIKVKCSLRSTE
jgi:hypothetical protein